MDKIPDMLDRKVLKIAERTYRMRITHYVGKGVNLDYVFYAEIGKRVGKYRLKNNRLTELER